MLEEKLFYGMFFHLLNTPKKIAAAHTQLILIFLKTALFSESQKVSDWSNQEFAEILFLLQAKILLPDDSVQSHRR